jgi:hypothetical protein
MIGQKRIHTGLALAAAVLAAQAQPHDCNAPAASPSVTVALPARTFGVAPSRDGCRVFVSMPGEGRNRGIAVLTRADGKIELSRVVRLKSPPTGIALTHDGRLLIAAATDAVVFLDVQRMTSGAADPVLGSFANGDRPGSIYANVTADDKLLFVSDERAAAITVIDPNGPARTATNPAPSLEGSRWGAHRLR